MERHKAVVTALGHGKRRSQSISSISEFRGSRLREERTGMPKCPKPNLKEKQ
jgi:hypothetical protein